MYASYVTASPLTEPTGPGPPPLWPVMSMPHVKTMRATNAIAVTSMIGFVAARI